MADENKDIQISDSQLTPEQFAYRLLADIGEKSGPGEASYRIPFRNTFNHKM